MQGPFDSRISDLSEGAINSNLIKNSNLDNNLNYTGINNTIIVDKKPLSEYKS